MQNIGVLSVAQVLVPVVVTGLQVLGGPSSIHAFGTIPNATQIGFIIWLPGRAGILGVDVGSHTVD